MLIMQWTCQLQMKLFSADVKSAFMQSDPIDKEARIFIQPSSDMKKRLATMMEKARNKGLFEIIKC